MVRGVEQDVHSELGLARRLRRRLRIRVEKVLDRYGWVEPRPDASRDDVAAWAEPVDSPATSASAPSAAKAPTSTPAPVVEATGMTFEAVQEVFDDMVRPALQADGGDITLRAVVDGEVRVTLVGACSTCPSSIHTMKHGIERLLEEEFEDFRSLVQVDG